MPSLLSIFVPAPPGTCDTIFPKMADYTRSPKPLQMEQNIDSNTLTVLSLVVLLHPVIFFIQLAMGTTTCVIKSDNFNAAIIYIN